MLERFEAPTKNREIIKSLIYFLERSYVDHTFSFAEQSNEIEIEGPGCVAEDLLEKAREFVGRAGKVASRVAIEVISRRESDCAANPDLTAVESTDIEGVYSLASEETRAIELLDRHFAAFALSLGAETVCPPVFISQKNLEKAGYLKKEAHQIGHVALGSGEHVGCLSPAACLSSYPVIARRPLKSDRTVITFASRVFRMEGNVFPRNEPLSRLREYQVREIIFFGSAAEVEKWKLAYFEFIRQTAEAFDLPYELASATDVFFHAESGSLAVHQLMSKSKYETNFLGPRGAMAISSLNLHDRHFVEAFGIQGPIERVTSACIGFGLERWLRAMILKHGTAKKVIETLERNVR